MRNPGSERRCLRLADWPDPDRDLWLRATSNRRRSFRGDNPAAKLAPASVKRIEEGYGRWLGALLFLGELRDESPEQRPTTARVEAYFDLMQTNGNRGTTILTRLVDLERALSLMYPGRDFRWIQAGGVYPYRYRVSLERRPIVVVDSAAWLEWAELLLGTAAELPPDRARADLWQDGLIIGCLGMRGMRQRTLLATRIGANLIETADGFDLAYGEADMKCRNHLTYPLPAAFLEPMRAFLATERPRLLAGADHAFLWVGADGAPLQAPRLKTMIRTRSRQQFGVGFGTHVARHALATSARRRDPASPGIAAAILGATAKTVEKHYALGQSIEAFDTHNDTLEAMRRRLTD